jgi:hypothetical protein
MRSNYLFCVHVHSTSYSRDFDKVRRRIFSLPETMAPQCWHDFFWSSVDCCDCSRFPLIQLSRIWVVDGLSLLTVLVTSIYEGSIGRPTIWFLFHRICLGLLFALKNGEQRPVYLSMAEKWNDLMAGKWLLLTLWYVLSCFGTSIRRSHYAVSLDSVPTHRWLCQRSWKLSYRLSHRSVRVQCSRVLTLRLCAFFREWTGHRFLRFDFRIYHLDVSKD